MTTIAPGDVWIVVVNWNRRDETLACLRSLAAADLGGARVVVVDNGSHDGSADAVRAAFPAHRVIALARNEGYAGGNNAGIRLALAERAAAVCLLNNDTEVAPDFLCALCAALESSPRCAAVCAAVHRADRPQLLDVAYASVSFDRRHAVQIMGVNKHGWEGFDARVAVDVAVGCCVLLRADALREVGLLDEAYFAYHEDVDWCLRARRAGWEIFFEPWARVYHRGSSTTAALAGARPAPPADAGEALPGAEPMPWNPIRTYLGARNLVRLLRAHATPAQRRRFVRRLAAEMPLELLAAMLGREGWLRLGRFSYRDALALLFVAPHASLQPWRGTLRQRLVLAAVLPFDLLVRVPRAVLAARRAGRFAEPCAYLRGLWDGAWRRPLPLERLGLR